MLEAALQCPTGDDVFGEDPTVLELESYMAGLFGKKAGLFVPTGEYVPGKNFQHYFVC